MGRIFFAAAGKHFRTIFCTPLTDDAFLSITKLKMECLDAGAALIAIRRDLCSVIRIDMSGKTILERTGPKLINECWF